jgi:predicted signal transduction protein with EAL and GGDEF domain
MTVSFGVAEQLPGERFDKWFRRADYALYQAKNAGRNQVQIYHEEELPENVIMNGNLEALPNDGFALNPDHPSHS